MSHESVIREWTADDPQANVFSGTSREVFRIGQFAPNHNIGTIAFNPTAEPGSAEYGLLYASLGDAGAAHDPRDYGQSLSEPHGAIIRIDPLAGDGTRGYGVPADNPFVGQAGVAPEIWAYGLRHAQQFSWDTDGRMFMGDIGQNSVEEVNLGIRGANYGWRLREGMFATGFTVPPRTSGAAVPASGGGRRAPRVSGRAVRPRRGLRHQRRLRLPGPGHSRAAGQVPSSPTSRAAASCTSTPTGSFRVSSSRSGNCGWLSTARSANSARRSATPTRTPRGHGRTPAWGSTPRASSMC